MRAVSTLLRTAHAALREHCRAGDAALDATAGNGHDAVFLAELVGEQGAVLAMDKQEEALRSTAERLARRGMTGHGQDGRIRLIQGDHRDMAALLERELPDLLNRTAAGTAGLAAAVFNLGFLPGSDKRVRTEAASTLTALEALWPVLRPDGLLSVHTYSGHAGAQEEADAVAAWMHALPWGEAQVAACTQWNKAKHAETLFLAVKAQG